MLIAPCTPQSRLMPGTAVIVEGVRSQPEWNGRRGLVQTSDEERGRYELLVKGRTRSLGVPLGCCRLESMVEQERERQEAARVAAKRAVIAENVRTALAARQAAAAGSAAGSAPESEHASSIPSV